MSIVSFVPVIIVAFEVQAATNQYFTPIYLKYFSQKTIWNLTFLAKYWQFYYQDNEKNDMYTLDL